ncbi:MAG: hypothetical protein IID45_06325 [Planctomycetes bacterium]|nr:hypothetical protein [Planctomycetota bacterium]
MSPIAEVNRRLLSPGGLPMDDVHQSESEQLLSRQQQLLDQLAHVAGSREVKGTVPELTADAQRVQQILKSAGADIERLRTRAGSPVDVEGVRSDLRQAADALGR